MAHKTNSFNISGKKFHKKVKLSDSQKKALRLNNRLTKAMVEKRVGTKKMAEVTVVI